VDQEALIAALSEKRLRGAGLDVFDPEPVQPESQLLKMPNVVVSAHLAGTTYDTFYRRAEFAFENIQGIVAGNPPMAQVHPEG
jgi:phosphoglycerate dehydrogenase-like enzyme